MQTNSKWASTLAEFCAEGRLKDALAVLYSMNQQRTTVDVNTHASLVKACAKTKSLAEGMKVHAHMMSTRIRQNVFLENALVSMYAECGRLVEARLVFDKMLKRNIFSWNSMIRGYVMNAQWEEAIALYYRMHDVRMRPDKFTFPLVLKACAGLAALEQGKEIHHCTIRSGFESDPFVANGLVAMYAKCKRLENARHVFDKMSERDPVSWNAMIAGYAQSGNLDEAVSLFNQMQATTVKPNMITWSAMIAGFAQNVFADEALKYFHEMLLAGQKPDWVTVVSVLPASSHLAALQHGKEIHGYTVKNGFESHVFVKNALIDMYSKCGNVNVARQVFDKMSLRDLASWSAMIGGYGMHGRGQDGLTLFHQMQTEGVRPDHITFVSVLSACSHSGLVDEGWQYFDFMCREHCIKPMAEHYACMVDLLGRAGLLDEAYEFVRKMPLEPTASVWGALLGACRIHCNVELGEKASRHLLELEPENDGNYVLLSNMYAVAGRWDDVTNVRTIMKDRRVKKKPGFSWIEVKNKTHSFLVGDRSHPQSEKIYAMLESLAGQLKEAGYVPDTRFVLQDVE